MVHPASWLRFSEGVPEYGLSVVDPKRIRALDRQQPAAPGRTPLKSYMVFFYRLDHIAKATFGAAPELPEDEL